MIVYSLFPIHPVFHIHFHWRWKIQVSPWRMDLPPSLGCPGWFDSKAIHMYLTGPQAEPPPNCINVARIGWRKRRWIGRSKKQKSKRVILLRTLTNKSGQESNVVAFFLGEGGRVIRELTCPTKQEKGHHRLRVLPWEKGVWSFPGGF